MGLGASGPSHPWTDAWLLLAAGLTRDEAPVPLAALLQRADGIQHAIPTFDEVDGGLARLQHAGLLTVRDGAVVLTAAGRNLVEAAGATRGTIHAWQTALEGALGAAPWSPTYQPADARREPALEPAMTRAEYESAVGARGASGS